MSFAASSIVDEMKNGKIVSSVSKFKFGGAIALDSSAITIVSDVSVEQSFAKSGGAIYIFNGGSLNTDGLTITNVSTTVSSNTDDSGNIVEEAQGYGGAILLVKGGMIKGNRVQISHGQAKRGGAIFGQGGSEIGLNASSLSFNSATLGGGAITIADTSLLSIEQ